LPFVVNRTLSEGASARLGDHVQRCSGCRAEHHEWTMIAEAANTQPAPPVPRPVLERVWDALASPAALRGAGDPDFGDDVEVRGEPTETANRKSLMGTTVDLFNTLNAREREILTLRFGLEDGRKRTLEEVGREFGVTRERVRQIEAKALRKLRQPSRAQQSKYDLDAARVSSTPSRSPDGAPRPASDDPGWEPAGSAYADGWVPPQSTPVVPPAGVPLFAPRELRILCLIAQGRRDREIAEELSVNMRTVSTLVFRMLNKLKKRGVDSRAALAAYATSNGYCTSD
jgi:RNA polymerase sigma factor (sigma-70 family)